MMVIPAVFEIVWKGKLDGVESWYLWTPKGGFFLVRGEGCFCRHKHDAFASGMSQYLTKDMVRTSLKVDGAGHEGMRE